MERQRRGRRKKKRDGKSAFGKGVRLAVALLCLILCGVSAWRLYVIFGEYAKGEDCYDDLRIYVDEPTDGDGEDLQIDFDGLQKKNRDLAAWIRIDEPIGISYPVMQSDDNAYYLRRLFDKTHNILGSIFIDCQNSADLTDQHTLIYGHNTKDGSMFGGLSQWKDAKNYEDNPYFYIYLPDDGVYIYQVCAVAVTEAGSEEYRLAFEGEPDFLEWEASIQGNALYDTGVGLDSDSKIVTLSTCTNRTEDERLVVHGVRIKIKRRRD